MYPQWEPQNLPRAVPSLSPEGVDLLSVSFLIECINVRFPQTVLIIIMPYQLPKLGSPYCFVSGLRMRVKLDSFK